ncbi:tRNA adenosine(34) deaminase TadA [Vitreoscilla stercoraria]|uniref:tRNA-specific adenosine deaminase n=1 Tax=Vitreoscilla stercoraria TaxID=61 RepID=A0ABY4EE99_VITST|nr:tRNA adenosine(34) deaminase TadA [Vitreoscilla stercoraria]UOO93544.1 tRNA adenosine(34) deaminase TadA [Vitreoscilla stercoraria]
MNTSLSTPPLSPSVVQRLHTLNLHTVDDLQQVGAATAFAQLKASGLTVTSTVLWQLGALCHGVPVQQLDSDAKQALQDAYKALPPIRLPPPLVEQKSHMQHALRQAQRAFDMGEIPIGAVVVHDGKIIAAAHNECIQQHFVGAHAEMLALQRAGQILGTYRLSECDLYVTVEPCTMCCGALLQSRIQRVFYGIAEAKMGAVQSQLQLQNHKSLNHHSAFFSGILADDCRLLMQNFFKSKR